MKLKNIFLQARKTGYLTSNMKMEIEQICAPETQLSTEEYLYLDFLMGAILSGEIH